MVDDRPFLLPRVKRSTAELIESFKVIGIDNAPRVNKSYERVWMETEGRRVERTIRGESKSGGGEEGRAREGTKDKSALAEERELGCILTRSYSLFKYRGGFDVDVQTRSSVVGDGGRLNPEVYFNIAPRRPIGLIGIERANFAGRDRV